MITLLKTYFANIRHLPSSGAAVLSVVAYLLNKNANVIPPDIANNIMMLLGPLVLLLFVGEKKA